jgi:hypothetical protein
MIHQLFSDVPTSSTQYPTAMTLMELVIDGEVIRAILYFVQ